MILRASTAAMDYDLGRIETARHTVENIDNQHGAYDSWLNYLQFVDHLRNGEHEKARQLAWLVVPNIAPYGGQSEIAYSVLADDALASGEVDLAITLLEVQFELTQTMFRQFEDGVVRGRSSAFVALALARLYFASGMDDKAEALVSASREMFEREIADGSPWAAPNTNAYALSLLLSGERELALQALSRLPNTYLRRAWYLESNPAFASLQDKPEFQDTVRRIDERIRAFREVVESDAAESVSCLPQAVL